MTTIKDLENRVKNAEVVLKWLKDDLTELKEQEKGKEPESLLGRWATHPEHGRVIIVASQPDSEGDVQFAYRDDRFTDGVNYEFARPESLALDPLALNTVKDFNDAPEGTIAEIMVEPKGVYVKRDNVWRGAGEEYPTPVQTLAKARVIRWGNGQ
ncbi:hypothetical protein CHU67_00380 [Corynebacterium sp. LK19]|uniref:hypothetical protein n=1 Tax=Corynebacterium sp. LK19 TaxID=2022660 RepID=UPI0011CA7B25|nr:hypothetical protein [Corynebacterium sp. LK19]TXS60884.1 hypothetical protein CHU67_00380 [Corynebacterium sp. LK19]